jgi:HEAT repeat protein
VSPADLTALGHIIDGYGKQATAGSRYNDDDGDGPRSRALGALALIEDARVVPHLAAAAAHGTYSEKFVAMGALAKFDGDGALHALVAGLRDTDPNIQAAAAAGLDRSKHPRAVESLWTARAGAPEAVRLTLVHALGRTRDATTTARLAEMTRDPSKMVRDEAKRYLSERRP